MRLELYIRLSARELRAHQTKNRAYCVPRSIIGGRTHRLVSSGGYPDTDYPTDSPPRIAHPAPYSH